MNTGLFLYFFFYLYIPSIYNDAWLPVDIKKKCWINVHWLYFKYSGYHNKQNR